MDHIYLFVPWAVFIYRLPCVMKMEFQYHENIAVDSSNSRVLGWPQPRGRSVKLKSL